MVLVTTGCEDDKHRTRSHPNPLCTPFTADVVSRRREVDTAACQPADGPAQTAELLQNAELSVRARSMWAQIQNVQMSSRDLFF